MAKRNGTPRIYIVAQIARHALALLKRPDPPLFVVMDGETYALAVWLDAAERYLDGDNDAFSR